MASSLLLALGAPAKALLTNRTVAACSAGMTRFMSAKSGADTKTADQQASYVYQSPGSSIHDPVLTGTSVGNPVYQYDPKPATAQPIQNASKPTRPAQQQPQQQARPTAAYAQQQVQQQQQQRRSDANPTYTYMPPGSSVRDVSYGISVKDPVYVVDPAPAPGAAKQQQQQQRPKQQQVATPPPPGRSRVGLPVDDLANVSYVTSAKGSMAEPRYVSVSDPQDRPARSK